MSLDIALLDPTATYDVGPLYDGNITHNLVPMARKLGIYEYVWRPEENNIHAAHCLIMPVYSAINRLRKKPEKYNADNDWGTVPQLLKFLEGLLEACKMYPKAKIYIWR